MPANGPDPGRSPSPSPGSGDSASAWPTRQVDAASQKGDKTPKPAASSDSVDIAPATFHSHSQSWADVETRTAEGQQSRLGRSKPANASPSTSSPTAGRHATESMNLSSGSAGGSLPSGSGGSGSLGGSTGAAQLLDPGAFANLAPGRIILDKYRILRKLGNGAMGDVWLVEHTELEIERALKVITQRISANAEVRKRFRREAKIMARMAHTHAVGVHDFRLAANFAYIEMEYVEGRDVRQWLVPGRPMPLPWIGRILGQLCSVLELAHEQGVVHRDLKPSNMMILSHSAPGQEHLKVLDFGIARIVDSEESMATENFLGTVGYASPEQLRCEVDSDDPTQTLQAIDHRSDIYSIGVMLYEFLTGHRPFTGAMQAVLLATTTSPPPPMAKRNPHAQVPPALERLVQRCLAKSPADRPSSVRELADEFFRICPDVERPPSSLYSTPPSSHSQPSIGGPKTKTRTTDEGSTWDDDGTDEDIELAISQTSFASGSSGEGTSMAIAAAISSRSGSAVLQTPTDAGQTSGLGRTLRRVAMVVIGAAAIAAIAFAAVKFSGSGSNGGGDARRSLPEGFTTINEVPFFQGDWPEAIVRRYDKWKFVKFGPGVYLPEGYKPNVALGPLNPNPYSASWPAEIVRESDGVAFRLIAGGTFQMGRFPGFKPENDPQNLDMPAHPVKLNGYYLQVNEVTNGEIEEFLKTRSESTGAKTWRETYSKRKADFGSEGAAKAAAAGISRQMAEDFALSRGGRLPTEAQWEFAARSRDHRKHPYVWDGDVKPSRDIANVDNLDPKAYASSRYSQDQTDQGIFAMMGNVREWCRDAWRPYPQLTEPRSDPFPEDNSPNFSSASEHTARGSSPLNFPSDVYVTRRDSVQNANAEFEDIGLRMVIECPGLGLDNEPPASSSAKGSETTAKP